MKTIYETAVGINDQKMDIFANWEQPRTYFLIQYLLFLHYLHFMFALLNT